MFFLGDFQYGKDIVIPFTLNDSSGNSEYISSVIDTCVPTLSELLVIKQGDATDSINVDIDELDDGAGGNKGLGIIILDVADHDTFYTRGYDYQVVLNNGSICAVLATFSIENRYKGNGIANLYCPYKNDTDTITERTGITSRNISREDYPEYGVIFTDASETAFDNSDMIGALVYENEENPFVILGGYYYDDSTDTISNLFGIATKDYFSLSNGADSDTFTTDWNLSAEASNGSGWTFIVSHSNFTYPNSGNILYFKIAPFLTNLHGDSGFVPIHTVNEFKAMEAGKKYILEDNIDLSSEGADVDVYFDELNFNDKYVTVPDCNAANRTLTLHGRRISSPNITGNPMFATTYDTGSNKMTVSLDGLEVFGLRKSGFSLLNTFFEIYFQSCVVYGMYVYSDDYLHEFAGGDRSTFFSPKFVGTDASDIRDGLYSGISKNNVLIDYSESAEGYIGTWRNLEKNIDAKLSDIEIDTNEIQGKLPTNDIMGSSDKTDKDDEIDSIKSTVDGLNTDINNIDTGVNNIEAKLPSKSYLAGTDNSDGDIEMNDSTGDFNATQKASINSEADQALSDYDPPTRAELTSDKNEIISEIDDNETKIDTVDNVVDAIKLKTDNLPGDPASDTNVDAAETAVLSAISGLNDLSTSQVAAAVLDASAASHKSSGSIGEALMLTNTAVAGKWKLYNDGADSNKLKINIMDYSGSKVKTLEVKNPAGGNITDLLDSNALAERD